MNRSRAPRFVALLVTAFAVSLTASQSAAESGGPDPNPPVQPSGGTTQTPTFQELGHTAEMSYVPVPSCKVVDTRTVGGRLRDDEVRSYRLTGTDSLVDQGGSDAGCNVPANAAVAALAVKSLDSRANGSISAGADPSAVSGGIIVYYKTSQPTVATTNLDLADPSQPSAFSLKNTGGPTHVVVSVVGYYIAPMGAYVDSSGAVINSSRVVSSAKLATGQYEVVFDRDITKCFYNVSSFVTGYTAGAEPRSGKPNGVFVYFQSTGGSFTDNRFYLTVAC